MDAGRPSQVRTSTSETPRHQPFDDFASSGDEDESFGITFTTAETKCDDFYERGVALASQGQYEHALESFLACLKKMRECQYFSKLPQTLKQLAQIYHNRSEYKKAIEFAQAENLFYEAVNADRQGSVNAKKNLPNGSPAGRKSRKRGNEAADTSDYAELLISKADEYDTISRHYSAENQFSMALDHCGKAVKIRQLVLGSEHPHTVNTMDHFNVLCAKAVSLCPAAMQPAGAMCTDVETAAQSDESTSAESSVQAEDYQEKCDATANLKCEPGTLGTEKELEAGVHTSSVHSHPVQQSHNEDCISNSIVSSKTFTVGERKCGTVLSFLSSIPVWLVAAAMVALIVLFV